jgi:HSP20 family protein
MIRFNPAREMWRMRDEMDNMFRRFHTTNQENDLYSDSDWTPRVNVSETENGYILKAELPGVSKDDVKITLKDDVLTLRGEKKSDCKAEGQTFHICERVSGKFSRSFRLHAPVDKEKIEATFENGVLTMNIPKAEDAKPKEIEISMN